MGLTRLAEDPWSESHTVPTFVPTPVEVKSTHIPLTAERAEELVKTHLVRNGRSLSRGRELPELELPPDAQPTTSRASLDAGSGSRSPGSTRFETRTPSSKNTRSSGESGGAAASPTKSPLLASTHQQNSPRSPYTAAAAARAGGGGGDNAVTPGSREAADPALLEAWMRPAELGSPGSPAGSGAGGAPRHKSRPFSAASSPMGRRLSCPEGLLNLPDGSQRTSVGGREERPAAPQDALEPLANHHAWAVNRGGYVDGGLLYSASNVLRQRGDGVGGASMRAGWQPRDVASLIEVHAGGWDIPGGDCNRINRLKAAGASPEALQSLAAVIIQSYCRGWLVRRRVARMRATRQGEEAARQNAEAAAAALAREQAIVRKKLRAAAKDCLLAVQAQQDYDRARLRMAAARGLGPGAAAAAPPPPPSIPQALWERCKGLGMDPIRVLLDSGWASQQIEDIIAASRLATQLPCRCAAAAAGGSSRFGGTRASSGRFAAVSRASGTGASDNGAAAAAASAAAAGAAVAGGLSSSDDGAGVDGVAAAGPGAVRVRGGGPVPRRLSLPGRPLMPAPRVGATMTRQQQQQQQQSQSQPQISTTQLVEQMIQQQQQSQQQHQQQQLLQQHQQHQQPQQVLQQQQQQQQQSLIPGPSPFAVAMSRRASGAGGPPSGPQPQLRRLPSPSRSSLPLASEAAARLAASITSGAASGAAAAAALQGPHRSSAPGQQPSLASAAGAGGSGSGRGSSGGHAPLGAVVRGHSRRMSDFLGSSSGGLVHAFSGGGGGGSSGGGGGGGAGGSPAGLSLAAVGSSAVMSSQSLPPAAPDGRGPVRMRSLGTSDSGGPQAPSAGGGPHSGSVGGAAPQAGLTAIRVVLPAVPTAAATGGVVSGSVAGLDGPVGQSVDQGAGAVAGSGNSPVVRLAATGQANTGPFEGGQGSHALRRHHSFAEMQGRPAPAAAAAAAAVMAARASSNNSPSLTGPGSGASSGRNSFSGGMPPALSVSAEMPYGGGASAAALALLGRSGGGGGGGGSGRASRGTNSPNTSLSGAAPGSGPLPPLLTLMSQGSGTAASPVGGGSGGSLPGSGTASPSLGSVALSQSGSLGGGAPPPLEAAYVRTRRVSNLGPLSGPNTPGGAVAAAPPPGVPPATNSPITFRRLHSLSSTSTIAAAAAAAAYTPFTSAVAPLTPTPQSPRAVGAPDSHGPQSPRAVGAHSSVIGGVDTDGAGVVQSSRRTLQSTPSRSLPMPQLLPPPPAP